MTPTGVLLVTPIFRRGSGSLSLLQGPSRVALALHKARCGTPLGVTTRSKHTKAGSWLKFFPVAVPPAALRCSAFLCPATALRGPAAGGTGSLLQPGWRMACRELHALKLSPAMWNFAPSLGGSRGSTRARRVGGVLARAPARWGILAEGAIALLVTLSGSALFAS